MKKMYEINNTQNLNIIVSIPSESQQQQHCSIYRAFCDNYKLIILRFSLVGSGLCNFKVIHVPSFLKQTFLHKFHLKEFLKSLRRTLNTSKTCPKSFKCFLLYQYYIKLK